MKVLICEDDPLIAVDLSHIALDCGAQTVELARDATEARAIAAREDVDVAIVDINLSDGASGLRIARALSALGAQTLVVSGNQPLAQSAGGFRHTFVQKPYPLAIMEACIKAAMRKAGTFRAAMGALS